MLMISSNLPTFATGALLAILSLIAEPAKAAAATSRANATSSHADWSFFGSEAGSYLGSSVASAGDVNGDGTADVVIGAPSLGNGTAFGLYGSHTGLLQTGFHWSTTTTHSATLSPHYATTVATAGDINGDGYHDVLVGAPDYSDIHGAEGAIFVYYGSADGVKVDAQVQIIPGTQNAQYLGYTLAAAGDVNNDGFDDVIAGCPYYSQGTVEGAALLFLGSAEGLALLPTVALQQDDSTNFGLAACTAGDVNADGHDDLIIGATRASVNFGEAYLYLGTNDGVTTEPVWTSRGTRSGMNYGYSLAPAGDLNNDGFDDVIVGSAYLSGPSPSNRQVDVFYGSASGLSDTPSWSAGPERLGEGFGAAVAGAGDVNGDGFGDILIGNYGHDIDYTTGTVRLYLGSANGLPAQPSWTVDAETTGTNFGTSVAGAGDVNGDGYDDFLIGAKTNSEAAKNAGAAFLFYGSAGIGAESASIRQWQLY